MSTALMSSYSAPSHGVSPHASSCSQPTQIGDCQFTHNQSREVWSDRHLERLRLERCTVVAEFEAVRDQFSSGTMPTCQFQSLNKHYLARLEAVREELDEELKKEAPSPVQKAMDWGYTQEDAEKIWHNLLEQEDLNFRSSRNGFLYRRNVRGH
ncbi:hypothetical protein DENSPDRAFT_843712 [Dentipellis sp. KUC8613]|nr:hypothetical protein DENSPDRAFT_843712 [Dentipellis sp. KUC8613]